MARIALVTTTLSALALAGCGSSPAPSDGGTDASVDAAPPLDAPASDARPDAGGSGCVEATVDGPWSLVTVDDVSAEYSARIEPDVESMPWDLYFESQHVFDPATGGPVELAGTFTLGTGPDENYGTCAHCVIAFYGTMRDRGYFARAGTIAIERDPFELKVDVVIDDLELVEVTIDPVDRSSTVVPGGDCIHVAHLEIHQEFPPPGWTCPAEEFADGERCDCGCGILDWDCTDHSLPVDRCTPTQLCRPIAAGPIGPFFGQSVCANDCDRDTGATCPGSEVCIESALGDLCTADPSEFDRNADLGEACAAGALVCAVDAMGFANGYCDLFDRADGRCRPRCSADADCDTSVFEHCYVVNYDTSGGTERPFGYCALRYPEGWTCSGGDYQDGARCDCGCGVVDPDCYDLTLPVAGCDAGEICPDGVCAPAP